MDINTALGWLSFFVGSGVLIFICKLIFSGGKYCKTIDLLENKVNDFGDDLKETNKKLDTLINCFNRLTGKLEKIKGISDLDDVYFSSASPTSLTIAGQKMLEESGLKIFIDTNKDEIIKKVKDQNPQANYDIERISKDLMMSYSNDPRIITIKNYAFNHGRDLTLMLMASGIYLRDLVIKELDIK